MKRKITKLITTVATLLLASGALAQTNVSSVSNAKDVSGQVVVPEETGSSDVTPVTAVKPDRPERQSLPPEVKDRIEKFKLDARNYLDKQQQLKKQMQGANDKERALIRERMKELRRLWLERSRELRKEYKERMQELADKLPEYRELLESMRDNARDQLRAAQSDSRDRRGED